MIRELRKELERIDNMSDAEVLAYIENKENQRQFNEFVETYLK